jgi:membrane protease YdiL (CAAX protease family)
MEQVDRISSAQGTRSSFFEAYRQVLPAVLRHPATWLLAFLMLSASVYLLMVGKASLLLFFLVGLTFAVLLVVIPLTHGRPADDWEMPAPPAMRGRFWLQCGLVFIVVIIPILLANFAALRVPIPALFPLYHVLVASPLVRVLLSFLAEAVLALVIALLLGVRLRAMGFQKGYHSGRVAVVLSLLFIAYMVFALAVGRVAIPSLVLGIVLNFFADGVPEEITWRGIFLTRLIRLLGTGWGIAVSALIFAVFHLGTNMFLQGSSPLVAIAQTFLGQLPGGIFYAVVFLRTRSLISVMIPHALNDVVTALLPPI